MIDGSIWAHIGPHGWPEVNKNNGKKANLIISDIDFFLRLCHGDKGVQEVLGIDLGRLVIIEMTISIC